MASERTNSGATDGVLGFAGLPRGEARWGAVDLVLVGAVALVAALPSAFAGPPAAAAAVLLAAVLVAAACTLRVDPVAAALGLAALAITAALATSTAGGLPGAGPAASVPGLLGGAAAVAASVLLGARRPLLRVLGGAAALLGIALAPALVVPAAAGVAVATGRRWAPTAAVALAVGGAALGLLIVAPGAAAPLWPSVGPVAVVAPALAVAVAAFGVLRLGSGLDAPRRTAVAALAGLATTAALVVGVVSAPTRPGAVVAAPGPGAEQVALAGWITSSTDAATTLSVPADLRADLLAAGVPATRLVPGGTLVVRPGVAGPALARFGEGSAALVVDAADPAVSASAVLADGPVRAGTGAQLAGNRRIAAPPAVLDALRTGKLDRRAMLILAALAARERLTVVDLPLVAGEDPAQPRHEVALTGLSAESVLWLAAQLPPFRPRVADRAGTTVLTWPVPGSAATAG